MQLGRGQPVGEVDEAVDLRAENGLGVGCLKPRHAAADHACVEADLGDGARDVDRLAGLGADHHEIGMRGLHLAYDGGKVGHARRKGAVVDDLHPALLRCVARTLQKGVAELNVGGDDGDGRRLRVERVGDAEERLHRGVDGVLAYRRHAEIFVVFELRVVGEAEQAHQHHVVLHRDRQRRGDDRRRIAADDEVRVIDVEDLGVDRRHVGRVALVVVVDELHLPAEQAALGVLVLGPDLHGEQRRLAAAGERARLRHAEADLDRIGREPWRRRERRGEPAGGEPRPNLRLSSFPPAVARRRTASSRRDSG